MLCLLDFVPELVIMEQFSKYQVKIDLGKERLLHGIHSRILHNEMTQLYKLCQGKGMLVNIVVHTTSIVLKFTEHPIEIRYICIQPSPFLFPFSPMSTNWNVRAGVDYAALAAIGLYPNIK